MTSETRKLPGQARKGIDGAVNSIASLADIVLEPLQRRFGVQKMAYFFVLPNLIIFGIFILLPMILNFYYAFTAGIHLLPQDRPFVGAQNFQTLFACTNFANPNTCNQDIFWRAVWNTISFVFFQVIGMIGFSLITALALNRRIRARGFFRSVFFYPVLLSPVVIGLIWKWILQRDGVLNSIVVALGGSQLPFLLNADWARAWITLISIWAQMGFFTLILLAGLQAIPSELYEAGQIDGANSWSSFRFITLPMLAPTMLVVTVLVIIRAVQVFDQPFVLTGGGPGTATVYMVQYIYSTGFDPTTPQYGLAAAASIVLGAALLILTLVQLRLGRATEL
ncbi:MAG TPA: sugar ABC transporter permease [Phototrophicaceae bacterium]|nr:sugar ABC transporter permease [Phototrophicaceae bacterium]